MIFMEMFNFDKLVSIQKKDYILFILEGKSSFFFFLELNFCVQFIKKNLEFYIFVEGYLDFDFRNYLNLFLNFKNFILDS